jgi:hypothetical protein
MSVKVIDWNTSLGKCELAGGLRAPWGALVVTSRLWKKIYRKTGKKLFVIKQDNYHWSALDFVSYSSAIGSSREHRPMGGDLGAQGGLCPLVSYSLVLVKY